MPRCFLSRFLALFNINNDEAINDEASEDVSDNEAFKNDDDDDDETVKALCNRRARVRRRYRETRATFYIRTRRLEKLED